MLLVSLSSFLFRETISPIPLTFFFSPFSISSLFLFYFQSDLLSSRPPTDFLFQQLYFLIQVKHFMYLFILGCAGSLSLCRLSLVAANGVCSRLACAGFSLQWLFLLQDLSGGGFQALEHGFCACDTWASLLRGMWDLPGSGIEPVSPTLVGRFLFSVPPRKSQQLYF